MKNMLNSLPNDNLDWSKWKAYAEDKITVTEKLKFVLFWLPAFSPFPTMFSKGFLYRVIKSWVCVVNSKLPLNPLPHMPILGSSNSAANKDMMSEI